MSNILEKVRNLNPFLEKNEPAEDSFYRDLEELYEELNEEYDLNTLKSFENDLEEKKDLKNIDFFRRTKSKTEGPFKEEISEEDVEQYLGSGLIDEVSLPGLFKTLRLTELGEELYENRSHYQNLENTEKILELNEETVKQVRDIDKILEKNPDMPITEGDKESDYFVRKMTSNGSSSYFLTVKGEKLKQKIEDINLGKLQNLLEYDKNYNASNPEKLDIILKDIPYMNNKQKEKTVKTIIKENKEFLEQESLRDDIKKSNYENIEKIGKSIESLEKYAEIAEKYFDQPEDHKDSIKH
ncbi:MAG: hypothetical protein ABEI78_01840, partial [Candidatus Nanohaloarchaea archaeon]